MEYLYVLGRHHTHITEGGAWAPLHASVWRSLKTQPLPPCAHLSLPSFPLGVTAPCWIQRAKGSRGTRVCHRSAGASAPLFINVAARFISPVGIFLRQTTSRTTCWLVSKEKGQIQMVMTGKKEHVRILLSWSLHCNVNDHELLSGQKGDLLRTVCIVFFFL